MEPAGLAPFPPWWGKDICELRRLRGGLNCTSGKHQLHILCADSRKRPLAALKIAAKSLHISGDEECIMSWLVRFQIDASQVHFAILPSCVLWMIRVAHRVSFRSLPRIPIAHGARNLSIYGPCISKVGQRSIYELSGPDTLKFLQGNTTNNILPFKTIHRNAPNHHGMDGHYTGFLNPQVRLYFLISGPHYG